MAENGHLPASALAPIPGGKLAKNAALAWNAMYADILKRTGIDIRPTGKDSSYRTYDRQVYWRQWWCNQGKCGNAAEPGNSNHGLGLAVDVATEQMRSAIDKYGHKYGWAKEWSDAPDEWWHLKYREGVWKPPSVDLRVGSRGVKVRLLTHRLGLAGYLDHSGWFFSKHVGLVVKRFQRDHGLTADGVVGPHTWVAVNAAARKGKKR